MIVIPEKEIPKKAKTFFENPSYVIRFTQPFSHSWIHHSSYRSLHFMKPKLCKIYFSRLTTLHTNRILKCLIYARNVNKRKIIRILKRKRYWHCDAGCSIISKTFKFVLPHIIRIIPIIYGPKSIACKLIPIYEHDYSAI